MLEPTPPIDAPSGPETSVRVAPAGEGGHVTFELRTPHGSVIQTVSPLLSPDEALRAG